MQLLGLNDRFFGMTVVGFDGKKQKISVKDKNNKIWKYRFSEVEQNLDMIERQAG